MKAIINIEDQITGSWHQITVEKGITRLDGSELPSDYELHKTIIAMMAAFTDDFAGITEKDIHLAQVWLDREVKRRERN